MIQSYILLGTLGVHSFEDVKRREITVTLTLFSGIVGILLHLLLHRQSIYEMLAGALLGVFLLAFSYVSGGKIGMGDGAVFMLTGLYLGWKENLLLMFLSFSMAGVFGLALLLAKRIRADDRLPFVPFLFLAYSLMVMGQCGA